MAQLDELEQKITLDGDKEVIDALKEIGEKGEKGLAQLAKACEAGLTPLQALAGSVELLGKTLISLGTALTAWVDVNAEAIQKTHLLADAFGTTTEKLAAWEAAFAASGVNLQTFEQFAQRLAITIARQWPEITENVRNSATQQESAHERVEASLIRIQEAQQNLQTVNQRTESNVTNAAIREQEAYLKLEQAAAEAYATMVKDANSVTSANLSLEAAQQRLATLEGRPPSDADKKALEVKQAQLAVDQARQAASDALRKQQQDQAEAQLKQQKLEQEAADATLKHETAINEAQVARQKAELAVKEAITQREEAEQRAADVALKSIPKITEALKGLEAGNKGAAAGVDLTQVKVTDLTKAIIKMASAGGDKPPTGLQTMLEMMKLFNTVSEDVISKDTKLAIIQQVMGKNMTAAGVAAAEMLKVMSKGPEEVGKFAAAMEHASYAGHQQLENIEQFRDAITKLGSEIDKINRNLAAWAAPAFTAAIEAIVHSIESSDGIIHNFIEGVKTITSGVEFLVSKLSDVSQWMQKAFGFSLLDAFKVALAAIGVLIVGWGSALAAIPLLLGTIVTVVGYIAANWDKVKAGAEAAWAAATDNKVTRFLGDVINKLKEAYAYWSKMFGAGAKVDGTNPTPGASGNSSSGGSEGGDVQGHFRGGLISGPGSGTSDSIPARLSNGEFVIRAAAVSKFGVDIFHALNNMMIPGFASGGLVGRPTRMAMGNVQASRALNLTIDGNTFNGLRGPKNVVDSLASYAVSRQTSSAGRSPSWRK